jgi:hypothetical protein
MRQVVAVLLALAVCLFAAAAFAQSPREARLLITVVDPSNAVIPGATVTVSGVEEATRAAIVPPVQTTPDGVATVPRLVPGRYNVQADFPGFDPGQLKDVRLRPGDNKHVIVLPLQKVEESVAVGQDKQEEAADRRGAAFGTTLTREQMDALSDDPDEMQRQLQEMAGPGAVIRIDSFEGGTLPPKAQIKAIHITRDQFAAENHGAEGTFIDIITQPGVGPIRTNLNYNVHTSGMTARNPLATTKNSDQAQNYGMFINGGLIKNKASFSLGVRGNNTYEMPVLTAALPGGTRSETLRVKAPRIGTFINGNFDYAVTRDQTLRFAYNQNDTTNRNVGIGGYNLPDRAYTTENHFHTLRVQEAGPLGRRMFTNTRVNIGWTDSSSRAALELPTIRVLDAFTAGGAQVAGGRHSKDLSIASDLDYVRGIHSIRAGTLLEANWFRSDDTSNYLGTYTFESIDAYNAGRPRSYTRRIGDPRIDFVNAQAGVYIQDDIRVRKSLTLTPGVRYEAQTHVRDYGNIGPRFGVTWAPFKNGKTTLRASWGLFYDWLTTNTYEQTLRVDGFRQQELNILDPSYPDLSGGAGGVTPVNRYLLDPSLENAKSSRVSAGLDYAFTQRLRTSVTYRYLRGAGLLRGLNLNAPSGSVRPDPLFGNVIDVVSDGRSRQHTLQFFAQTPPPLPFQVGGPLWDWKKWGMFSGYTLTRNENNTDGAFNPPATGSLVAEWGVAPGTVRQRAQAGFSAGMVRNLGVQIDGQFTTGTPYTIQTGRDDNGDLIFNDRPAGVGRNTLRAPAQFSMNLGAFYSWTFGPKVVLPGGPLIYGTPAGLQVMNFTPPPQGRFRLSLNVFVQNLTNRVNLAGYSGVLTSPLYGKPTTAINPRRVNVGLGLGF